MDSIRKLSKHQVLIAGGNKDITGKILEECSNFDLGDTRISGCLPVYFGKLKRFRTLSIYTTMVSSEIPKEMGAMVTMTYYESKVNTRLRSYYRIHLIAGGNKDNPLG
ncbi:hypothetical protein RYX36_029573 [Vicia faba]